MVDNSAISFGYQIDNGIPILSFYDDKNDRELINLSEYLLDINKDKDFRQSNRDKLKLN